MTLTGNVVVGNDVGLFVSATGGSEPIGFTRVDDTMRENKTYYLDAWGVAPAP